jgi:biotin carboxyl carrier protein
VPLDRSLAETQDREASLHGLIASGTDVHVDSSRPLDGEGNRLMLALRVGDALIGALLLDRAVGGEWSEVDRNKAAVIAEELGPWIAALRRMRPAKCSMRRHRYVWAVAAIASLVCLMPIPFRVPCQASIQVEDRSVAGAPFEGRVASVAFKIGDTVGPEDVLVHMDDTELRLRLAALSAELAVHRRQEAIARRDRQEADARIAASEADATEAEADLVRELLSKASVRPSAWATVLSLNPSVSAGMTVRTGDTLMELGDLSTSYVEAFVPNQHIGRIQLDQRGTMAFVAYPSRRVVFKVIWISPIAEGRDGENVFRIRCELRERPEWLQPGLVGVATVKTAVGPAILNWSADVAAWIRMRIWI